MLSAALAPPAASAALPRALVDRTDDWPAGTAQVHVLYVLPSDGVDRALDTNGTLEASVGSFQTWLASQTGGRALRLDTSAGLLDLTFHRLARSDAEIAGNGAFVRDVIERDLRAAGLVAPGKVYAVYYDGSSTFACGGGAWPPVLPGAVAAMYLRGTVPGFTPCSENPFAAPGAPPGYMEFAMLHELVHTFGFVATCAPHHTQSGHVSDDPRDLMYAGPSPWTPTILDVGRDDYYAHGRPGCLDLAEVPFLALPGELPPTTEPMPPSVRFVSVSASPRRPRAGKSFRIVARLQFAGGLPTDSKTLACAARVGRNGLRAVRRLEGSLARCSLGVPRASRGKRLTVTLDVRFGEARARRTLSYAVS